MNKKTTLFIIIFFITLMVSFIFYKKEVIDIKNIAINDKKEIPIQKINNTEEKIIEHSNAENTVEKNEPIFIELDVPFTSQAPFGNWKDQRQENGCEEAAALIAFYWTQNNILTNEIAEKEIIKIADYEQEKYNNYIDTSSEDTVIRIFNEYFNYYNIGVKYNITIGDIINELKNGNLVLVPTNGQKLNNPFYTPPGPTHHELVIIGYDEKNDEFITNDPGTKHGKGYRYKTEILFNAIYDYKTGNNEPVDEIVKAMIIVRK